MASPTVIGGSIQGGVNVTSGNYTVSYTTPSDDGSQNWMLVALVDNTTGNSITVTWNTLSMTSLASGPVAQVSGQVAFYLAAPARATTANMVITASGIQHVTILTLKDAKQTSPLDGSITSNKAASTADSASVTTVANSIVFLEMNSTSTTTAITDNGTQVRLTTDAQPNYNATASYLADPTPGSNSYGYTWTVSGADDFYAFGILYQAPSGGGSNTVFHNQTLLGVGQ